MRPLTTTIARLLATLATVATPAMAAEVVAAAPTTAAAMPAPAAAAATVAAAPAAPASRRCTAIIPDSDPTYAVLGKSVVIPLKARVVRIVVSGQPQNQAAAPAAAQGAPAMAAPPSPAAMASVTSRSRC